MNGFGNKLKELRKNNNLTQKQLAGMLNQAQSTIVYWEKDKQEPSISSLKKICETFSISADYLLDL